MTEMINGGGEICVSNIQRFRSKTHQLVLICRDCGELSLGKYERPVSLLLNVCDWSRLSRRSHYQVDPRLELVHRVEQKLEIKVDKD